MILCRSLLVALALLIACVHDLLAAPPPARAGRPNVVIFLADDMGFSDVGCYGSEIDTPHLDRLAGEGIRFTQFYNTARCCPTRASLLTGLYPHVAGMGHMTGTRIENLPGYQADLSHDAVTIPEALQSAGYRSYMTGKWHVTRNAEPRQGKSNWPRQRGFDRFYGTIKGGGSYFDPAMLTRENEPISPLADPEYQPETFYYTDAVADQAARFVREHQQGHAGSPFFLYVSFTAPHWPLHAPEAAIEKYRGKYDQGYEPVRAKRFERMKSMGLISQEAELSPAAAKWEDVQHKQWEARCMEVYAAQVDLMDAGIGRVVDALRETNQLDDTLILFLADNGGCAEVQGRVSRPAKLPPLDLKPTDYQPDVRPRMTRDGRPVRDGVETMPGPADTFIAYGRGWANVSNTPFREYKHWVHEGGIATPLIAHWPKGIARERRGQIDHVPGHLIDLMPTFLELAGAEQLKERNGRAVPPVQGVSLAPAFRGEAVERGEPIFFEHEGNRAVRDGKWKLVARGADGPWELYDLEADRAEMHDLAAAQPDRAKALADAWQRWAEANHVLPLTPWEKKTAAAR